MDDAWLTYESFAPMLGATFVARATDGREVALTLAEANDTGMPGGVGPDGRTRTQFSVLFRGPGDQPLEQGTYELHTGDAEPLVIFLVPVGADADARLYEAVFA